MDFYSFLFSVEHPNFSSTSFGDTRKLKLRVPAPCKMDPAPSLIGFFMALCHLAARVGGEDGEFPLFRFDARTLLARTEHATVPDARWLKSLSFSPFHVFRVERFSRAARF